MFDLELFSFVAFIFFSIEADASQIVAAFKCNGRLELVVFGSHAILFLIFLKKKKKTVVGRLDS